jgi:hypothetical protein
MFLAQPLPGGRFAPIRLTSGLSEIGAGLRIDNQREYRHSPRMLIERPQRVVRCQRRFLDDRTQAFRRFIERVPNILGLGKRSSSCGAGRLAVPTTARNLFRQRHNLETSGAPAVIRNRQVTINLYLVQSPAIAKTSRSLQENCVASGARMPRLLKRRTALDQLRSAEAKARSHPRTFSAPPHAAAPPMLLEWCFNRDTLVVSTTSSQGARAGKTWRLQVRA